MKIDVNKITNILGDIRQGDTYPKEITFSPSAVIDKINDDGDSLGYNYGMIYGARITYSEFVEDNEMLIIDNHGNIQKIVFEDEIKKLNRLNRVIGD